MAQERSDPALEKWVRGLPIAVTSDALWRLNCYRGALFLFSLAREDALALHGARPFSAIAEQLARSAGSIGANIAEAYGRPTNSDRIRYFTYALGSVREATTWYDGARSTLDGEQITDRLSRLSRVRAMLIGLLSRLHRTSSGKKLESW
jgi:four helix bundle protein